jgi:flagellar biosynthesis protein FlhB
MGVLALLFPWGYGRMRMAMQSNLTFDHSLIHEPARVLTALGGGTVDALLFYLPLGLVVALAVVFAAVASGGTVMSSKPLMPDFSKIGLLSGFKRLFSRQQFFEVLKLAAVTALLALVGGLFVQARLGDFATLLSRSLPASLAQLGEWFTVGVASLLSIVALLALVDVPLQRMLHLRRLRMSLQEVKDEHKESDGNPQLKGRMRERQRELAQGNSVTRVPQADLVVMNPTHYAVALRYDDATMAAPHVIAKGADLIALRIRDMARQHEVPVLESPMLARALYAHTELDQQVPAALFAAVAQVLAYVFQLKAALRGDGPMPGQPPRPEVPPELDPHHVAARARVATPGA